MDIYPYVSDYPGQLKFIETIKSEVQYKRQLTEDVMQRVDKFDVFFYNFKYHIDDIEGVYYQLTLNTDDSDTVEVFVGSKLRRVAAVSSTHNLQYRPQKLTHCHLLSCVTPFPLVYLLYPCVGHLLLLCWNTKRTRKLWNFHQTTKKNCRKSLRSSRTDDEEAITNQEPSISSTTKEDTRALDHL